jgi:hypothetical protein
MEIKFAFFWKERKLDVSPRTTHGMTSFDSVAEGGFIAAQEESRKMNVGTRRNGIRLMVKFGLSFY